MAGPMLRARKLVEDHIAAYGYVPHPDKLKDAIAAELGFVQLAAIPHRGALWQPPETAPKDGKAFLFTTAGPGVDICSWVKGRGPGATGQFEDYYFKQRIGQLWPYMVAWAPLPPPARIENTEAETRRANGWEA